MPEGDNVSRPILYANQELKTARLPRSPGSSRVPGKPPSNTSRWGRPPTEVDSAARRKQPARPLHATSPNPHRNSLPQTSHHRFQTAPKPTPATSALATGSPSASSPKPPPQSSKQSPACVHNITWNSNHIPHPQNSQTRLQPAVFRLYCNR